MNISLSDKWYVITEAGVKNLLFDALREYSDTVLEHFKVTIQNTPLTIREINKFGDYLLPWYKGGNWATGGKHQTVASAKHIKLEKQKEYKIILAKSPQGILVVDGCHRAIALWQHRSKLKDINGMIYILSSPYIESIFAHDLI